MKEQWDRLLQKDGAKTVLASLVSILIGLGVGSIVVLLVGLGLLARSGGWGRIST